MTIPALSYFLPKSGEHDVTLMLFTADLSEPWKVHLVRMCKIDAGRGMQSLVAISCFVFFLAMGGEVEGGGAFRPPIGARVNREIVDGGTSAKIT